MAKEVLIFMHTVDDSPGYVAVLLQRNNINFRVIHSYKNEIIPELDDTMAGLIFLGGTMSVNDGIAWLEQEVRLIRQAIKANIPVIGHCLGGQLISQALGQQITKNPDIEILIKSQYFLALLMLLPIFYAYLTCKNGLIAFYPTSIGINV